MTNSVNPVCTDCQGVYVQKLYGNSKTCSFNHFRKPAPFDFRICLYSLYIFEKPQAFDSNTSRKPLINLSLVWDINLSLVWDIIIGTYRNVPKFLYRKAFENSADLKKQSDQGLHCLSFCLYLFDKFLYEKTSLFEFKLDYGENFGCLKIKDFNCNVTTLLFTLTSLLMALRAVGATNSPTTLCSLIILKYIPGSGVPTGLPYKDMAML